MDLRATFKPCTSGTPAPSSVPSIRQNRAMANCATSGPTSGDRSTSRSQMRRPFSEANQVRTRNTAPTRPSRHKQSVRPHHVADADDELRDQRQRAVDAGKNLWNFGMKNTSNTVNTTSARHSRMHG